MGQNALVPDNNVVLQVRLKLRGEYFMIHYMIPPVVTIPITKGTRAFRIAVVWVSVIYRIRTAKKFSSNSESESCTDCLETAPNV